MGGVLCLRLGGNLHCSGDGTYADFFDALRSSQNASAGIAAGSWRSPVLAVCESWRMTIVKTS